MLLSLSGRQERRTSVDGGSHEKRPVFKGRCFTWEEGAGLGRAESSKPFLGLRWRGGQPAPLQKSSCLGAGAKLLAQHFPCCDLRKHSPRIHPEKALSSASAATGDSRMKAEPAMQLPAQMLPANIVFPADWGSSAT